MKAPFLLLLFIFLGKVGKITSTTPINWKTATYYNNHGWGTCFLAQNMMGFSPIHLYPLRSSQSFKLLWAGSPGPGCLQRNTVTWQVAEKSPKHRQESTYLNAGFVVVVCVSLIQDLAPPSIKQQYDHATDGKSSTYMWFTRYSTVRFAAPEADLDWGFKYSNSRRMWSH